MIVIFAVGALIAAPYVAPDGRTTDQLIAAHVLPDPATTPGALNPAVTQTTIKTTICVHGFTATIRPPVSVTNKIKAVDLPQGFKMHDCELDHLESLENGGAPADPKNLWCEVYADHYGAHVKDVLETKVSHMVCAGKITLQQAQAALSPNWLIGYVEYVGALPR